MTARAELPDFELPFPVSQFPDYQAAAQAHMERLEGRGLLPTEAARKRYEDQQFPLMCAYAFPDSTDEGFAVALDLCVALAMIDNVLEAAPPKAQQGIAALLGAVVNHSAAAQSEPAPSHSLSSASVPSDSVPAPLRPVLALFADTWAAAADARGQAWAERAAALVMAWVAAEMQAAEIRAAEIRATEIRATEIQAAATESFATVDAYRDLRAQTVATDLFVCIAEAATGIVAPEWIWQHPDAVRMRRHGADLVGAINDVISADADAEAGAVNLVTVLQTVQGLDRTDAERQACRLISEDAQAFVRAAEAVAARYPAKSTDAERQGSDSHIDTFRNLAVSTDQWGRRSGRYQR